MNILLDTHMLIWAISNSSELPEKAKYIIEEPDNVIYFSALNLWEIQLKKPLYDKLIKNDMNNFVVDLYDLGLEPLPFFPKHTYQLNTFKLKNPKIIHKDPFDNALLAQAKSTKTKLLTHDHCFNNYDEDCIMLI